MQFERYIKRVEYMRELIEHGRTGTPKDLAKKIGISERMLYRYLKELNNDSVSIRFCRRRKSYIFE